MANFIRLSQEEEKEEFLGRSIFPVSMMYSNNPKDVDEYGLREEYLESGSRLVCDRVVTGNMSAILNYFAISAYPLGALGNKLT